MVEEVEKLHGDDCCALEEEGEDSEEVERSGVLLARTGTLGSRIVLVLYSGRLKVVLEGRRAVRYIEKNYISLLSLVARRYPSDREDMWVLVQPSF